MHLSIDVDPKLSAKNVTGRSFEILGVKFNAVQIPDVIRQVINWVTEDDRGHYICVSNVHSTVESQRHSSFKETLNASDLNVPDGMPIVWLGRARGHEIRRRVYGPELFEGMLHETHGLGFKHFFYGGTQSTLNALTLALQNTFPGLQIAGSYSPPFRPLTEQEKRDVIDMVIKASPDILWVGLGCPKQELWMREYCAEMNVPVMIGVGQAFNIYAGQLRQAPRWMREHGLEWLFRLFLEPRRLWKRYLVYNTLFLYYLSLDGLSIKSFR
jgi:N-acetylglucosaminyldiphosphoundecaprenol N-acetyl-beta-D-mannosaminyltransferase